MKRRSLLKTLFGGGIYSLCVSALIIMAAGSTGDELEIPYYEIPPTYEEFLENHLIPNKPCIIGACFTRDWKANKEWIVPVVHDSEQEPKYKPNYMHLRKQYGTAQGQVARCNKRHFTDQERTEMSFADFCTQWEEDDGKPSFDYLKDLHLQKTFPDDNFYTVPNLFEGLFVYTCNIFKEQKKLKLV